MALYQCDSCGQTYPDPWCEKCQRELTNEVDDLTAAIARTTEELTGTSPAPVPVVPPPPPPPTPKPRPTTLRVAPDPAPAPAQAEAPKARTIVGLDKFNGFLAEGRKAVVICGPSRSGKSEIASGFTRANNIYRGNAVVSTLRSTLGNQYSLGGTLPGEVWFQPIGQRHIVLDPSGEFFKLLTERGRRELGIELTDEFFDFVRSAIGQLAAIVLVFDLTNGSDEQWREQENDFNFLLAALRWLRFDKQARRPEHGVGDAIVARSLKQPRLDVPVLVLFSKADRLEEYTMDSPLAFARNYLPVLHGALMTNAKRYRYDFCHTMVRHGEGDRAVDRPCGVLMPIEWLLDDRFRWIPRLPSRWLGGGK